MNPFNLFNKGVRKEKEQEKSTGPESYPTSHFGLEVYGLKHHLLFCSSCVSLLSLPPSAQESEEQGWPWGALL